MRQIITVPWICRKLGLVPWLVGLLLLAPAPDAAWGAKQKATGPKPTQTKKAAKAKGEFGIATYYAKHFAGRRTASGVVYRHEKLTAAHSHLPFGSKVRVVNPTNGREVTVTVNDRCRPRKTPYIDLSRSAAEQIGLLRRGSAKVRIIPLKEQS